VEPLFIWVPFLIGFLVLAMWRTKEQNRIWFEIADERGLDYRAGDLFTKGRMDGMVDDLLVTLDTIQRGSGKSRRTYTRYKAGSTDRTVVLNVSSEGLLSSMSKAWTGEDLQLGDPIADGALHLSGDLSEALAVLDFDTRHTLVQWVHHGGKIVAGDAEKETHGLQLDSDELRGELDEIATIAKAMRFPDDLPRALAERVLDNREPVELRAKALGALGPYPEVQARAVSALFAQRKLPTTLVAAVLKATGPTDALRPYASNAVLDPEVRADFVRHAHTWGVAVPRRTLDTMLRRDAEAASAVRYVLGAQLSDALEILTEPLADAETAAQVAIISGLAELRDIRAVESLLPLRSGMLRPTQVREAASRAVAALQAGAGGDRGGISIAGTAESGGLTEARRQGGLSAARKQPH
jgi:hypothetical protein